jgi:hypothetical protein
MHEEYSLHGNVEARPVEFMTIGSHHNSNSIYH